MHGCPLFISSRKRGSVVFVSAVSLSRILRCSTVLTERMSARESGSTHVLPLEMGSCWDAPGGPPIAGCALGVFGGIPGP